MTLLLRNLTIALDESEDVLKAKAAKRLRISPDTIGQYAIVRRAIDARDRDQINFVYNLEVDLVGGPKQEHNVLGRLRRKDVAKVPPPGKRGGKRSAARGSSRADSGDRTAIGDRAAAGEFVPGVEPMRERPIVIGLGPAGMFAALWLARNGYRPLVLERGQGVQTRHRDIMQRFYRENDFDPESNLLFGEGGAGAYSDGKLYTRVNNPRMRSILETFIQHGAPEDILIDARPHLGSDRIPTICRRIREEIIHLGGEVRFGTRLESIEIVDGEIKSIRAGGETIACGPLLLGIGHSARDTIRMLIDAGVSVIAKPFQLGVRVEHPQSLVDQWQYGAACGHDRLPPAEYHLVAKGAAGQRGDVYSFCMCPGGMILPTNEAPGLMATNGASRASRGSPFANSGLVLTVPVEEFGDDALAGIAYLERIERAAFESTGGTYLVPAQRGPDFIADRASDGALETSYPFGGKWTSLRGFLPEFVVTGLQRALTDLNTRMPGYAGPECLVTGPETRASSPVRIPRDAETRESVSARGLYPIGEGAGYAGGIMSAAVDGIATAETIMHRYAAWK